MMEVFRYQHLLIPTIILLVIFIIVYIQLVKRRKKIFEAIFDKEIISELIPKFLYKRRKLKDVIILTALFFLAISILGPQWGVEYKERPAYLANLAFVIDTSLSMSARDIKPTRLESVKLVLKSITEDIKGYRITIIAFQDKAYIQCPLTDDIDALNYFTDILKPNMLPYPGTNIADAILTTYEYLSAYRGDKIAVLFTDGEDHSGKVRDVLSQIGKSNLKFITVGIGSPEGDIIYDEEKGEPKKDKKGKTVISRLDEKTLLEIANSTGGKYIRYTTPEFVTSEIKRFIERKGDEKAWEKEKRYKNRYQYFLLIAFLLILIEFIMMEIPKGILVAFFIVLFLLPNELYSFDISSEFRAAKGNKLYKKKDYQNSVEIYNRALKSDKDNDKIRFNLANAFYRLNQYDEAIRIYETIKNKKVISKSLYNAGNAYYMKNDIEKAIDSYKKAILSDPKNEDAKYNLELLLKKKNSSSSSSSSQSSQNNQGSNKDNQQQDKKQNEQDSSKSNSQIKQQLEKFLEMIKNMERENMKKAAQQQKTKGEIRNEFDW